MDLHLEAAVTSDPGERECFVDVAERQRPGVGRVPLQGHAGVGPALEEVRLIAGSERWREQRVEQFEAEREEVDAPHGEEGLDGELSERAPPGARRSFSVAGAEQEKTRDEPGEGSQLGGEVGGNLECVAPQRRDGRASDLTADPLQGRTMCATSRANDRLGLVEETKQRAQMQRNRL